MYGEGSEASCLGNAPRASERASDLRGAPECVREKPGLVVAERRERDRGDRGVELEHIDELAGLFNAKVARPGWYEGGTRGYESKGGARGGGSEVRCDGVVRGWPEGGTGAVRGWYDGAVRWYGTHRRSRLSFPSSLFCSSFRSSSSSTIRCSVCVRGA